MDPKDEGSVGVLDKPEVLTPNLEGGEPPRKEPPTKSGDDPLEEQPDINGMKDLTPKTPTPETPTPVDSSAPKNMNELMDRTNPYNPVTPDKNSNN